jgi:hypothetical protein
MNKSAVCRIANRISRDVSRHDAFIQAWAIVKAGGLEVAVRDVSFGNRQEALKRLAQYAPEQVRAILVPEPENPARAVVQMMPRGPVPPKCRSVQKKRTSFRRTGAPPKAPRPGKGPAHLAQAGRGNGRLLSPDKPRRRPV